MKILESNTISVNGNANVHFIRLDPEDISVTLRNILTALMDLSWLKRFDPEPLAISFQVRAEKTISDIKAKFDNCDDGKLTKDAGEYVVSELSREAIVSDLGYLDIPLAELIGKKVSGNPGFDFFSQNNATDTVIFGEAKFISSSSAYSRALQQIRSFLAEEKDITDLGDLEHFCSPESLQRVICGKKGFAAAFSAKSTTSNRIIKSITSNSDFKDLLQYEEIILVAVNI